MLFKGGKAMINSKLNSNQLTVKCMTLNHMLVQYAG